MVSLIHATAHPFHEHMDTCELFEQQANPAQKSLVVFEIASLARWFMLVFPFMPTLHLNMIRFFDAQAPPTSF